MKFGRQNKPPEGRMLSCPNCSGVRTFPIRPIMAWRLVEGSEFPQPVTIGSHNQCVDCRCIWNATKNGAEIVVSPEKPQREAVKPQPRDRDLRWKPD